MSLNRTSRRAEASTQLVDAVMDAYVTWRERSAAVTYQSWSSGTREGRVTAYQAYVAAVDREEHAAAAYQGLLEQAAA
jgi:hypothetical protein